METNGALGPEPVAAQHGPPGPKLANAQPTQTPKILGKADASHHQTEFIVLVLRKLPPTLTRDLIAHRLDKDGFGGQYTFVHVPVVVNTSASLRYAVVILLSTAAAVKASALFKGFNFVNGGPGESACEVEMHSGARGLEWFTTHYSHHSVLMNAAMPDAHQPAHYRGGVRVELPFQKGKRPAPPEEPPPATADTDAPCEQPRPKSTAVMLQRLPAALTQTGLEGVLDDEGFEGQYNSVSLIPGSYFNVALLKMASAEVADNAVQHFHGFSKWPLEEASAHTCDAAFSDGILEFGLCLAQWKDSRPLARALPTEEEAGPEETIFVVKREILTTASGEAGARPQTAQADAPTE